MSPDDVDPEIGSDEPVDDLHERFAAFRTIPTPPAVAVADLPAMRPPTRRWIPAAAAAAVVLALLSLALVVRGGDRDADLTTAPDPSPTTQPTPKPTTTTPGTTSTAAPDTTVSPPTTADAGPGVMPTTPLTTRAVTTTVTAGDGPVEVDPTTTPPTTSATTTTVDPTIPPPSSVPAGAPVPEGRWGVQWSPGSNEPLSTATVTFLVRTEYVRCSSWPFLNGVDAPVITETDEAVVITFAAEPTSPMQIVYGCPDPPRPSGGTYSVTLSRPLGNRWVYDGTPERSPTPVLILDPNDRVR